MSKLSLRLLPEIFVSDKQLTNIVYQALKKGEIKKIASRLYTRNLDDNPEIIVKRNIWSIVASYYPGALISDRTALEHASAKDGSIFIISNKKRSTKIPGITIYPRKGIPPLASDKSFIAGLFLSSNVRAFLENMKFSRSRKANVSRTLSRKELEAKLESMLRLSGTKALLKLRDEARILSKELNLQKESKTLDELIGTLLGTRNSLLSTDSAIMRKAGTPYDSQRIELFQLLFDKLSATQPITRFSHKLTEEGIINLAFFEAYFSNFIEGTEFTVNEAEDIIFNGKIAIERPEDAYDIIGTYKVVSDKQEMRQTPKNFNEFILLLQSRHLKVMRARLDKLPGQFKEIENRAGSTVFVAPELVKGTLMKGFEIYQAIEIPFSRAVFMMFLVSEVHPFNDGNGRITRIMMNAELIAKDEKRIIIPTIFRNNYLVALKALSLSNNADPLIRTLDFAQKYTNSINWNNLKNCRNMLEASHAFEDSNKADMDGIRLRLPDHY